MCDSKDDFKLCTCSDEFSVDRSKPHWVLHRKAPRPKDEFSDFIVGEAQIDVLYGSQVREDILSYLRSSNCFDADLNIKQKDRLDIFIGDDCYQYELRRNGWQIYNFDFPGVEYNAIAFGSVASTK